MKELFSSILGYVSYESQTTPPVTAIVSTNLFPVAKFNISRTRVGLGEEVIFDASGSSDPDGTIAQFKWDFGDGGESSEQTVTHIYHGLGDYEVVLTVTDDKNATSEERQFIKVVMMYTLNVTSNAQVKIGGSGVYREGEKVVLTAPSSVSMPGILGLLGAKYVFEEWTGAFNSTQSTFEFVFTGYVPRLEAKAIYAEDYTGMIIILSVIVVALLVIVLLSLRRRKGKEIPPPPPPQPKAKS